METKEVISGTSIVRKSGKSQILTIPASIRKILNLIPGMIVNISISPTNSFNIISNDLLEKRRANMLKARQASNALAKLPNPDVSVNSMMS